MALGGVLAAASTQCGYPTFIFNGSGGAGGENASSSHASSSSHGSSGTGGGMPATCQVLQDVEDCGQTGRCTVVDPTTGRLSCVPVSSMPLLPYDACPQGDGDCPAGTWCDGRTSVCMPFCTPGSTCSGGGSCVAAITGAAVVPGDYVCTANCEPISAAPCGKGATCAYDPEVLGFDCFESGNAGLNDDCAQSDDCGKGLTCGTEQGATQGNCLEWCAPADALSCPGSNFCNGFTDPVEYGDTQYGYCD
jgi:hypothetical protein